MAKLWALILRWFFKKSPEQAPLLGPAFPPEEPAPALPAPPKKLPSPKELLLELVKETRRSTVSALSVDGAHICYVIEDGHNDPKIWGQTRIPAGRYEIVAYKSKYSKFYTRYSTKWGHKFVPLLKDVPGFEYILLHIGNTIEDTRGCLLPNMDWRDTAPLSGTGSQVAYFKVYDLIEDAFVENKKVFINIKR